MLDKSPYPGLKALTECFYDLQSIILIDPNATGNQSLDQINLMIDDIIIKQLYDDIHSMRYWTTTYSEPLEKWIEEIKGNLNQLEFPDSKLKFVIILYYYKRSNLDTSEIHLITNTLLQEIPNWDNSMLDEIDSLHESILCKSQNLVYKDPVFQSATEAIYDEIIRRKGTTKP